MRARRRRFCENLSEISDAQSGRYVAPKGAFRKGAVVQASARRVLAPAADRVLDVLGFLATQSGPVAAAVIARELALPRSSVYQFLGSLTRRGLVVHFPEDRKYGLGVGAFELSSAYLRQEPITRLGAPLLATLTDRLGESTHLAVLHGRDVLYLVEERATHRPTLVTDVGVRLPGHLTATGRSMLAATPAAHVRALYAEDRALETRTGVGPRTYRELRGVLGRVRELGYGFEESDVTPGISSVAIAVRDREGWPQASIAASFPSEAQGPESRRELAERLRPYAAELGRRLGASA